MKPRVRVYSNVWEGVTYFHWDGRGTWRINNEDPPTNWQVLQEYYQVPWVGF